MKLNIGETIRKHRREADLTQQQFAEQLGVSYQSVSRWENEETYPDMELLPAIAGFFKISVDELMGVPDMEKEKRAHETFDALRRAAIKPTIDPSEVIPLLREIRRNYLHSSEAWRPWVEGNDRCFTHPAILPEVRLTAEAYLALNPMDSSVLETMACIEEDERLDAFLKKHTTAGNTSRDNLLYKRYWQKQDREKLEPERRYKFYEAVDVFFYPCILEGLEADEQSMDAATEFQIKLLDLIREGHGDDTMDMWISVRAYLGIKHASILARKGELQKAIRKLDSVVSLLEKAMKITEPQILSTSCRWLNGMIWNAEEKWFQSENKPDEGEERIIYIYTKIRDIYSCYMVNPSWHYSDLVNINGKELLQPLPEYQKLLERVKALIEKRPVQK